ncbi:MurR/RpiR family transcriptional regulator [Defluviimonas salinarum]|uniref:MurR/RpiR family transcriptional regulator n=1 Tax=Defluviimonas salinarum TaxID=2992147 RepID=A0ABT3IZ18_9RHOB|nr:MurR/RpiR family transcriptional regulator [Defluviimonas salinarum]MCW3780660.1 MurR/RpiR family transcriptional regulator [Defluviimonas salinarum]
MAMKSLEKLNADLTRIASEGTPALASFASWVLDHYAEVAFNSIRGLAEQAGVNSNTVIRLAKELGFDGYDAFRSEIQTALRSRTIDYSARAAALHNRTGTDVFSDLIAANRANAEVVFSAEMQSLLEGVIEPMLAARRVHSIGVRSCYSIAHYFSYVGGMAFGNFATVPAQPGAIMDQLSQVGPDDIVVAISFEHYSTEVVRACQIARDCGGRILALTDSHRSPIARGAWQVIPLPMAGPQFMPSLNSAFIVVEMLLAAMAARSGQAAQNVRDFEARIQRFGGYVRV